MIIVILILAIAIILLANVLLGAAQIKAAESAATPAAPDAGAAAPAALAEFANPAPPASASPAPHAGSAPPHQALLFLLVVPGLSDTAFYFLLSVLLLEIIIIFTLIYNVRILLLVRKEAAATAEAPAKPLSSWWDKINRFKPVAQEADLDLGHDYDGIRELDNRLPPWWLYGFYCTIIFACIYLWRYHISHTAPLSGEEYAIDMRKAELAKVEYLKKAANNVDESTVQLLTGAADLSAGKTVFETTCFACHGKHGEGSVGPNLTDEYWLHGGTIQDVFKTIKYGWPDKGMKSWKDDYSPSQIAQIASYVKSLGGTHPDNPKAPQGTIDK